jgi:signal transduction histidine kinase
MSQELSLDPQLLKSALLNILINAIEASGDTGTIDVNMAESNGQVAVTITDRGKGIPPEIIDRVFDPYFSTKPSGTGLGLSLTKTIVEKHGGEISLESHQQRGTTVTVSIPARKE